MDDDEGIEDILEDAVKRMDAQIADSRERIEGLKEELEAAEITLRAATAHATKLRKMLDDPYLYGPAVAPPALAQMVPALAPPAEEVAPEICPAPELPPVVQRWKQKIAGDKRLPNPALTSEQIEERNQGVMKVLPDLWAKGGRVLAGDVMDATGYGTAIVYRAMKLLEDRGDIRIEKVPLRPGDKRVCNAILSPQVVAPPPKPSIMVVSAELVKLAIRCATEVRKGKDDDGLKIKVLAGYAIRASGLNVTVRDVAHALGVSQNLSPSQVKLWGLTQAEVDTASALFRVELGLPNPGSPAPTKPQEKPAPPPSSAAPEPQKEAKPGPNEPLRAWIGHEKPAESKPSNPPAKSYMAAKPKPLVDANASKCIAADPCDLSLVGRENAIMGALEEMWAHGDATVATLANRLVWSADWTRKQCWALKESGQIRIRHMTGRTYLLPKAGAPMPINSLFNLEGNPWAPADAKPCSMTALPASGCRFPINDAADPADHIFCGARRLDDSAYCATHEPRARASTAKEVAAAAR